MIVGIDEVGRGAWAGPLVVGACLLPDEVKIDGLTDSKKLTALKRAKLELIIKQKAVAYGLGWVNSKELDQIGLSMSLKLATKRAMAKIKTNFDQIIIDGTVDFLNDKRVTTLKKADLLIPSVSAAAILAKVARDNFMIELASQEPYQHYGFENHVGYGTKAHQQALVKFGVSDQHRYSFKPIAELLGENTNQHKNIAGTAKSIGNWGEDIACQYLENHNYQIMARNWRTKLFEIDIVAQKNDVIYLVEVKTRKNDDFGGGVAAINPQKVSKMELASQTILQKYPNTNIGFLVMIITGDHRHYKIEII